jgi:hypothetical protein
MRICFNGLSQWVRNIPSRRTPRSCLTWVDWVQAIVDRGQLQGRGRDSSSGERMWLKWACET